MAAPSHDGSARGATSPDLAPAVPSRPETFGRPVVLSIDESVPSTHRSRRPRGAHRPSPQIPEERMGFMASTALAVVSLVFVSVVALELHARLRRDPPRRLPRSSLRRLYAFHEPVVLGVLFGLAVFWLLPPHPWAAEPDSAVSRGSGVSV